jgi:hypothetical protein
MQHKPSARFFDIHGLADECHDASPEELAAALHFLVERGVLRRVYRVVDPYGVVMSEVNSLQEVPDRITDSFDNYFETNAGNVVPGFRMEKSGVER